MAARQAKRRRSGLGVQVSAALDGGGAVVVEADCLDAMREMPDACVDGIVTDPPYGLSYGGSAWDKSVPGVVFWKEALRVAKPGAFLLSFCGTRFYHRLAVAVEDAGWDVRDMMAWLYAGQPKGLDVSKAMDSHLGAKRSKRRIPFSGGGMMAHGGKNTRPWMEVAAARGYSEVDDNTPVTEEAALWQGWRSTLRPCHEPICVAMKPVAGNFVRNALEHGVCGLNALAAPSESGAWSGNVAADDLTLFDLDQRFGAGTSKTFYCPKVSREERAGNDHLTVKPISVMRWLVRLLAPPTGGIILDPFAGSGTTGVACVEEGVRFLGFEMDPHYADLAAQRVRGASLAVRDGVSGQTAQLSLV